MELHNPREVTVLVTTLNPDKLDAVKNSFYSKLKCTTKVSGCKTNSGVPDGQPYGMDGTYQGALYRLSNLQNKDADYLVSIENGIVTLNSNNSEYYLDFPIVVILETKTGKQVVHFGQSRHIPLDQMKTMKKEGKTENEIGEWCHNFYEKTPWISRQQIIEAALLMALDELLL